MKPNQDNKTQGEIMDEEHPVALPGTHDVIRRFDRNTTWLATGLLGSVIFAALVLAVQELRPRADDLTEEATQTRGDLLLNANLLNANPAALSEVVGSNGKSTGDITLGQATSADHGFNPEINHPDVQANESSWSSAHSQDPARAILPKLPNGRYRSSVRPRFVDAKMRLIALWHQSLVRSERSRSWTLFSKSNAGDRKKVSYTAETNH
jgi:hypothetical protein